VDGFDFGRDAGKWAPFVTQTFEALKRDSVRTLVLDLRENEGGSDEGALLLLQHLIRTPITMPPLRRYVAYDTVPAALRPYLRTWDKAFYDRRGDVVPRGDGSFDLKESAQWPAGIPVARNAFTGRVFVLTSYVNSSASHIMLRLLARRPGITLVGDPTGGSLRASTGGNLFFMTLPGTGMEVDVPLIAYDWGMSNRAGGVQPDIAVPAREAMATALEAASAP
jgi:C-terminal processing protease CtpA/Prc